jgi:sodium-dependent dicarboxylate transporter 2/3/5
LDQLQIGFFFISGFLVSRVLIKTRLPQKLVRLLLGESHCSLSLTLLYLIGTAAAVSFFIPNAVTVLTLLPVLDLLSRAFRDHGDHRAPTLLTLAVLYGANIGGMGSVTGTPTNLVLVGYLQAWDVPGADRITYLRWLLWGVPLVTLLALLAWGVLCASFRTWRQDTARVKLPFAPEATEHPWQHRALAVTLLYLLSSILLSYLLAALPQWQSLILIASGIATLGFIAYLFLPWANAAGPLLTPRDTVSGLPKKGLELLAVVLVLGGVTYALNLQDWLAARVRFLIPETLPLWTLLLIVALITSFATELFSNTVVQLALFLVLPAITEAWGFDPIQILLVVTLSCTCAFMSPIATPVNALAFGGAPGSSLWRWLAVGTLMNIVAAVALACYVFAFVDFGGAG